MKNATIAVMIALLSAQLTYAQEFRAGVKGGLSINSFSVANLSDAGTRLGVQLGVVGEIGLENTRLPENFYLQPEILFSTRGAKYTFNAMEVKERLSYFDVPILLKYFVGPFNVYAGPQISFLSNGKYKYESNDNSRVTNRDAFRKIDYGLAVGLGYELPTVFVDVRYGLGLHNVIGDREVDLYELDTQKARNRGLQVSVGYYFLDRR